MDPAGKEKGEIGEGGGGPLGTCDGSMMHGKEGERRGGGGTGVNGQVPFNQNGRKSGKGE